MTARVRFDATITPTAPNDPLHATLSANPRTAARSLVEAFQIPVEVEASRWVGGDASDRIERVFKVRARAVVRVELSPKQRRALDRALRSA